MKYFAPLAAALTLSSCVTYHTHDDGIARARIGETVTVSGPQVTPRRMLEDSRCPQGVQCVWAGQVRISATVKTGAGIEPRELTLNQPIRVADGQLTMVEAYPAPRKDRTVYPEEYRFGFKFAGGI
ncbi:MAG: hypothetical protein ABIQ66_10395 [Novosphingobium sp.]